MNKQRPPNWPRTLLTALAATVTDTEREQLKAKILAEDFTRTYTPNDWQTRIPPSTAKTWHSLSENERIDAWMIANTYDVDRN